MARARNIKPGFFENEELAELGPEAMLLFVGLWTLADREGRLEDRPRRIKAQVFPYFEVNVDATLDALTERKFIVRYAVSDTAYIQVINFARHQRPHSNETQSVIPACPSRPEDTVLPSKEEELATKVDSAANQGEQRFGLIPDTGFTDSLIPDTGLLDSRAGPREGETPYQVLETFCDATERDIGKLTTREKNASLAVAKRLLADGVSCAEVSGFVGYLAGQDWRTNPVTLFTVEKEIGTWRASGAPAVPKARASPPSNGRATLGDFLGLLNEESDEPPGDRQVARDAAYSVSNGQTLGSGRQRDGPSVGRDAQRR